MSTEKGAEAYPGYPQQAPPAAYGAPAYGQPAYGQPAYGQPAYGAPAYPPQQPGYPPQQPGYPAQPYGQPGYPPQQPYGQPYPQGEFPSLQRVNGSEQGYFFALHCCEPNTTLFSFVVLSFLSRLSLTSRTTTPGDYPAADGSHPPQGQQGG